MDPVRDTAGGALSYSGFVYANILLDDLVLPTPSGENVIATSPGIQITAGQPVLKPINSTIAAFDLHSLRYACVLDTVAATPTVQGCTVKVTGVKATEEEGKEKEAVVQELVFNPVVGINEYASAFFHTFDGLKSVNFQVIQPTSSQTVTVLLVDNLAYKAYYRC